MYPLNLAKEMLSNLGGQGYFPCSPRIQAVNDIIHNVSLQADAEPVACSVSNEAGVYYAQLYVPGHIEPMMVALHGVTSDSQAAQALESFARLRATEL